MPDPRSLVSTALLQPIVVESREDEAALVSMADLGALGTSLDSSAVWSEYWSVDVEVRGRDMDTSLSALVFDGVQADVRTRAGGSVSNVSNVALSTLASNGSDGSAAGLLQVYPVASFSGVFRGSLVLVFREKRNAAQRVEVVRPLAISWRRRDLDLSVALRSMVFVNETVSLPPRQLVSVALDRASALLVGARLDVQSVSMAVPRWSDFVLLHRVKSDGGWQVSGELQSSDARWLKTAEVVLAPRTAKSQTVTVRTNVTLVDAVSSQSVVVEISHLVRSMPDPRSLVSTALLQPIVVESREDEAALVSMADLGALGTSLDSSAADVRTRAGGSVSNVSNVALSTLASNGSDGSAAGLLQVYPVASFSGVFRGSLVLVFREKRNAAQRVEVVRPLAISWRRRDLDLSVALRSMVFVNETVSLPPRQLVSVALDRASALLVGARLDVQSVSMAVPRWSDFVLLHRVKSDGGWQVSGELQSSDARWLKTAEVVLAPRTAKSQTVTVRTNVTLVDAVSSQSVVVEISHLVRSMPDPRSLVSTALLQPIVVESREDEAALVSMADLGALGTSLDSSAVWSEYWSVDVEVRGRDMDTSLSALVFDGVQADVRTRAGGSVSNVSNVALSTLASNGSDGSAAGLLQVYPVASFSGVFRGSLVLVFREKRNAAQRVEVVRPLAISWRRRDLDLSVALRSMVFVNETVSLPPRQLVSVALDRASALLVGARLDVQSVSMAVPRWSDFVLLHRSSDARWLKTAEVVLAPRTAKSQTVTVRTNVTLVDAVSSQSVVVEISHLVRSMPDPRSLVSTALLQPIVVESREDEAALVSMADLGALGTSLDSSAVWSEYWSVDVEVRGRDMDTSLSALVFDGVQADVRTRAGGSVSNVSNVALSTLASNGSDGSAAGLLQVYPVASFSGVFRGSLVLVFREKRNAAQRVEVVRPLAISWRRRDLDLSVALRSMVFVNETVSLPPRQLVSVALDRASALLVGARLDVQSVSMAVPRWSDFVLLHRVKSDGGWQVSGELQSSDARWLKTAEVVLAPRTAKSQTVTVRTNVTLVDAISHLVRSMPDPRSLVSTALLQPIVVESREDEAALVSMADLGALGTSLDSSAVWSEYWSVDVEVRGRDTDTSLSALVFDGVQADVRTRAGGSVSNVSNVALSTLASNGSDGSAAGLLQVYPVASFSGVFRGSLVLVFREKRNAAQRVEVVRPLAISWRRRDLDLSVALRSMVFVNETVSLPPRQLVSVALDRASALLVGARLDVQSVSMAVSRWSDFVLLHRVKSDGGWQVSGELQSSDARWLKTAEVVLAPRTAKSQTVTVRTNVTLVDAVSLRSHAGPSVSGADCTATADRGGEREDEAALVSMADLGALGTSLDSSAVWSEYWSVEVEMRILLYWMPAPKEVDPVLMELTTDESRNATISGEVLDALIATVFSDGYQLVPANPYFSGFATLTLRQFFKMQTSHRRHFDALPNVTVVVTVELFIAPVATAPVVNATAVRSTAPLGTAIVLSIGAISLRDVDGSEELSVELATEMDLDAVAVFFNGQLLQPLPAPETESSASAGEMILEKTALSRVVYALPIPTSTDGIMDADVMLIAADNLFTGRFSVSLTATSRGVDGGAYCLLHQAVGLWLRGQKDTPVSIALSNIRGRLQAETPSSDTNKLVYGPCRLVWDTDRVQAVFVDEERMSMPVSNPKFKFNTSENLSVLSGQGYYGEVTISLSVDVYSSTLNQVYMLTGRLRISVVPTASSRILTMTPNGSAPIHVGYNRKLDVVVSEVIAQSGLYHPDGEVMLLRAGVDNADAVLNVPDLPFWRYEAPALAYDDTVCDIDEPSELVWNHAQAPRFNVVNASSRVYEDELGVLTISELSVAELDATAPDVDVSLEVLLPQNCNLSVSVNGTAALASGSETLDDTLYAVVPVSVESKVVHIIAKPSHSTHVNAFLRASVYAFSSWNCTSLPVALEFLTVAEKPTLSIMMTNMSTHEDGVFTGTISVVPTKEKLLYRIQAYYPSEFIAQVEDRNWIEVNRSDGGGFSLDEEAGMVNRTSNKSGLTWPTSSEGTTGHFVSLIETGLVDEPTMIPLWLVPVAKMSGNLSVDIVVVALTTDVDWDLFESKCFQDIFSNEGVYKCLPIEQRKSVATVSESIDLMIYPVAEAPRIAVSPAEISITENDVATFSLSNWTLGDVDGSEEMYLTLRCERGTWRGVSDDGVAVEATAHSTSTNDNAGAASTTVFELLPIGVYGTERSTNLSVELTPPSYFSGPIDCRLVVHAIDRSGGFVAEDTYETPLSVTVVAEATVPLISIATTNLTAVEDGVVVCDSVLASLVDVDGSETLFLVVDLGEYEAYVTSATWRSDAAAVMLSTQEEGVVPSWVYGSPSQRMVAAEAGSVEMYGTVEIELVAGYSGELSFSMWSASVEKVYLTSSSFTNAAIAAAPSVSIDVFISPVANSPLLDVTLVQPVSRVGTAIVLSIGSISLRDLDGSEELSVELAAAVELDTVAVFFNGQLVKPKPFAELGPSKNDSGTASPETPNESSPRALYALPVQTFTDGIVDAEVMLVATNGMVSGKFNVSITATSRELYISQASDTSRASTVIAAEVGWVVEPTVYYGKPMDFWRINPPERVREHFIVIPRSLLSIFYQALNQAKPLPTPRCPEPRTSHLPELVSSTASVSAVTGRLWPPTTESPPPHHVDLWKQTEAHVAERADLAVFVDDEKALTSAPLGGGLTSLTFAEYEKFELNTLENLSVIPGQGYYGEVTISLSVDVYSSTLNQVYMLTGRLRISVVPTASSRILTMTPNGSAPIHVGYNRELDVALHDGVVANTQYKSASEIRSLIVSVAEHADATVRAQEPSLCGYGLPSADSTAWTTNSVFVLDEESESMNNTLSVMPPRDYVGALPVTMQSVTLTSSLIPSELVISETAIDVVDSTTLAWLTVLSTSIVETVLPTQWNHAQAPRFNVVNASSRVYEDELGVLTISELSVAELDATAPDVDVSLEVLLPQNCNLSVSVNGTTALASGSETLDDTLYAVVPVSVESKVMHIIAGPSHSTHVNAFLRASVYAFSS
ncbi:hypothetical protein PInf_007981 [Phytophthora infestans]|nr:hypothetical protein PInf_007981 [Phytophthora infestans]